MQDLGRSRSWQSTRSWTRNYEMASGGTIFMSCIKPASGKALQRQTTEDKFRVGYIKLGTFACMCLLVKEADGNLHSVICTQYTVLRTGSTYCTPYCYR